METADAAENGRRPAGRRSSFEDPTQAAEQLIELSRQELP